MTTHNGRLEFDLYFFFRLEVFSELEVVVMAYILHVFDACLCRRHSAEPI